MSDGVNLTEKFTKGCESVTNYLQHYKKFMGFCKKEAK